MRNRTGVLERLGIDRQTLLANERVSLPTAAVAYIAVLVLGAIGITVAVAAKSHGIGTQDVVRFAILATAAAAAQVFIVRAPRNQTYHTTVVFLLAAVLLLPAVLLPAVAIVQHVPDVVTRRHRLRFTIFNTANHALDMLGAAGVVALIAGDATRHDVVWALAGAAAAVVLVAVNHVLLAGVIRLTRGYTLFESGLFTVDSIAADVVPAGLGVALATFWLLAPWLIPLAVLPLFVVQRNLIVPFARRQLQLAP